MWNLYARIARTFRPRELKWGDYFRNNIRDYYACMTEWMRNIGRLMEALKRMKLFDNTIVVFTSDHGICMGAHHSAGKDIYEESMKVPMIISWPQTNQATGLTTTP